MMANSHKPVVAAFDFDGTLTYRDSLLPFLHFVAGTSVTAKNLILESPHVTQYLLGYLDRQGLKEAFLSRFLKNKKKQELSQIAEKFVSEVLPRMIRPKGLEKINWHKGQGHRCILISANLDIYLKPWGIANGFQNIDIITSLVDFSPKDKVTGTLKGLNCRGVEKVRRLAEIVGSRENYILYAYGDSEGDRELLETADYPFYRCF